jgi:CIC family chloride channel protein
MAAMFTAVVRAPLTGSVLAIEMTGRADCALAMLVACMAAAAFATAVGSEPIYDTLRKRMLAADWSRTQSAFARAEPDADSRSSQR